MNNKIVYNFTERANRIFDYKIDAENDALIENQLNKKAYTFLMLVKRMGLPIRPFDEARLTEEENWMSHLVDTQNVSANEFELPDDWYKCDFGTFMGELKESDTPCILYKKGSSYYCKDYINNKEFRITKRTAKQIKSDGLLLSPKIPSHIHSAVHFILRTIQNLRAEILPFIILSILISIFTLFVPMGISSMLEDIKEPNSFKYVAGTAACILFVLFAMFALNIIVNNCKSRFQVLFGQRIFTGYFARILTLSAGEIKKMSNELINQMTGFINAVDTISGDVITIFVYFIQCVAITIALFVFGREYAGILSIYILFCLLIIILLNICAYKKGLLLINDHNKLATERRLIIDNMETYKINASEERAYYQFSVLFDKYMKRKSSYDKTTYKISLIVTMFGQVGCWLFLFTSFKKNELSMAKITLIYSIFSLLVGYISMFVNSLNSIITNLPAFDIFKKVIGKELENPKSFGTSEELKGQIGIHNLRFAYGNSTNPILRNINMTIKPGQYIGIVGPSGCGKSTLIRLLLGFEKPQRGIISFDGLDIDQYDLKYLRRQIGVVLQDCGVMAANILRNIAMSEDCGMEDVYEATKLACIYDDIEKMPMKYSTIISNESDLVSGGQKQRIVLARALYKKPKILILDEATSALDNVTQKVIKENLGKQGMTRIVIAHRLSTIVDCDKIFVIDKGVVVEEGTYSELMAMNGVFANMARRNIS